MQIEILRERERALTGQKADASPSLVVSATSNTTLPFGVLVVQDDTDPFLCKPPVAKAPIDKPLGVTVRQLHCEDYQPKSSVAVMRKGRVWVNGEKVSAPGDVVYIKFIDDGSYKFSGEKAGNLILKGAIFLDRIESGLVPIEVNFFGGVQ